MYILYLLKENISIDYEIDRIIITVIKYENNDYCFSFVLERVQM
jgi:hypothetical protein